MPAVVFSPAFVAAYGAEDNPNLPRILWDNEVTTSNIVADEEADGYPATNLANAATNQWWWGTSLATQYLTVTLAGANERDCVGIARHNLGTTGATVSVEGITADIGAVWTDLGVEMLPGDDGPIMFLFEAAAYAGIRVKIVPGDEPPRAAVLSVGKSLQVMVGPQPGLTPFPFGVSKSRVNGEAANGDFLGTIVTRKQISGSVSFKVIESAWYRANMDPFIRSDAEAFFFAWRPADYPQEVGFAKFSSDPSPVWSYYTEDYLDITLQMTGLAL